MYFTLGRNVVSLHHLFSLVVVFLCFDFFLIIEKLMLSSFYLTTACKGMIFFISLNVLLCKLGEFLKKLKSKHFVYLKWLYRDHFQAIYG